MRIYSKSNKKGEGGEDGNNGWAPLKDEAIYQKTNIQRSGWRIPGALNLDDEEDYDQVLDDINGIDGTAALNGNIVKRPLIKLPTQTASVPGIVQCSPIKRQRRYFYQL